MNLSELLGATMIAGAAAAGGAAHPAGANEELPTPVHSAPAAASTTGSQAAEVRPARRAAARAAGDPSPRR
jgi:hypothetical protein